MSFTEQQIDRVLAAIRRRWLKHPSKMLGEIVNTSERDLDASALEPSDRVVVLDGEHGGRWGYVIPSKLPIDPTDACVFLEPLPDRGFKQGSNAEPGALVTIARSSLFALPGSSR